MEKYIVMHLPKFFGSPLTQGKTAPWLDYLDSRDVAYVLSHCNGLLLLWERVVNPATRQWVVLPPPPPRCVGMADDMCLVFDPAVSPHYEVFYIPYVTTYSMRGSSTPMFLEESEWPPSRYNTGLLFKDVEMGGEVVPPERGGGCRDH